MKTLIYQRYYYFLLTIFLLFFTIDCPSQTPSIDSLQNLLNTKISEEQKAIALAQLSQEIYYYDFKKSLQYAQQSLEIAQEVKSKLGEATAYQALGYYYYYQQELYWSRLLHQFSLGLFKALKNQKGIADELHHIGLTYFSTGQYEESLRFYTKSLEIRKALGDELNLVPSLLNIAIVLEITSQIDKSLKYYQEAFDIAWKYKKNNYIIKTSYNLANTHLSRRNYQKALAYSDTTLKYAQKIKMEYGIGRAKRLKARIYNAKQEPHKALKFVIEAEAIFEKLGANTERVSLLLIKSDVFQIRKDYVNMKKTIQEAQNLIPTIKDPAIVAQIYQGLYLANKGLNDFEAALEAYEKEVRHEDSIFKLEKDKQINELLTKYETAEKELTIKELDEKNRIQALQIERQTYQIILAVVILLLLSGLAFTFYQQKKWSFQRKLFDLEQKHLRSQLNPHFIFNALNAIQDYLYQKGIEKGSFYLVKFAHLMRQTLEQSRVNYISLEDEITTIEHYIQLQQLRFEHKFDYQIHVDEAIEIDEIGIPPMFLQPIVENAIEHGFLMKDRKGKLDLFLREKSGVLQVVIQDNGVGISKNLQKQSDEYDSLATKIIQERIQIFRQKSKKHINFEIIDLQTENQLLQGTKVNLQLPYIEL